MQSPSKGFFLIQDPINLGLNASKQTLIDNNTDLQLRFPANSIRQQDYQALNGLKQKIALTESNIEFKHYIPKCVHIKVNLDDDSLTENGMIDIKTMPVLIDDSSIENYSVTCVKHKALHNNECTVLIVVTVTANPCSFLLPLIPSQPGSMLVPPLLF